MHIARDYSLNNICRIFLFTLVAWLINRYVGNGYNFSQIFNFSLSVWIGFGVINTIGDELEWRIQSKKKTVDNFVRFFKTNNFPQRIYSHDGLETYLSRINNDYLIPAEYFPAELVAKARSVEEDLWSEPLGMLFRVRVLYACELALDIYAPKSNATKVLGY